MRPINYSQIGYIALRTQHILNYNSLLLLANVKNMAKRHHRLCEYDCNGEGYLPAGVLKGFSGFIRCDNDKAYIGEDTVFVVACAMVEEKIGKLLLKIEEIEGKKFTWEFQHDPRGATVKISFKDVNITEILYL